MSQYPPVALQRLAVISFTYKNYRGEISERKVQILHCFFGATEWHFEPQWLLNAIDLEKEEARVFAMRDMSNVKHSQL